VCSHFSTFNLHKGARGAKVINVSKLRKKIQKK